MSKESKPNITRRNVLAGIGASGVGLALGAHGVAAGEKKHKDKFDVPVAIDWQEAVYKNGKWKKVEAFPDHDNDRHQDDNIDYCDDNSTLLDHGGKKPLVKIDDPLSSKLRTDDKYTDPGDPLINYHGVKPGHRGEVTLSYHVCDAPGKVRLKAKDVAGHKKFMHRARARVWYDGYDRDNNVPVSEGNDNHDDNGHPGDNEYQKYDSVIAQGSLKHVLKKLEQGVRISKNPYVASPDDKEGIHYYAYPRDNTSGMETPPAEKYDPGWITDDNIDECVDDKKVKKLKHLDDGVELCIDGTGYVARNEDKPLHDLCTTVKKVITDKKGTPIGFRWKSNLPICRIKVAGKGDATKLNVYDRAYEGVAMAPRRGHDHGGHDNHDDHHGRHPITGVRFGVCDDHDKDDWCIKNSTTGYIGFEWWVPKHVDLKKKSKFQANFDFKAKLCVPDNGNGNGNGNGDIPPIFCGCGRVCACDDGTVYSYRPGGNARIESSEEDGPFCASTPGQIVAVEIGDTTYCNPNQCAETGLEFFEDEYGGECDAEGLGSSEGTCSEPQLEQLCDAGMNG